LFQHQQISDWVINHNSKTKANKKSAVFFSFDFKKSYAYFLGLICFEHIYTGDYYETI